MGKHFSWMLAAILTCGLVLTTSCRKEVVPEKLEGLWYNQFVSTIYPGEYKDIIHTVLEFGEDGEFHMLRYAYDKSRDMCRRREYRMAYSDLGIVDGKQSLKVFTEDRPDAYSLLNWTVTDNILSLIEPEYEDVSNDFHPLTLDDLILMKELKEKCK